MPIVIYDTQQQLFPYAIDSRDEKVVNPVEEPTNDSFDGFFTIKKAAQWAMGSNIKNIVCSDKTIETGR